MGAKLDEDEYKIFLDNLKLSKMTKSEYIRTAVTRPAEIDAKIIFDQFKRLMWNDGRKKA